MLPQAIATPNAIHLVLLYSYCSLKQTRWQFNAIKKLIVLLSEIFDVTSHLYSTSNTSLTTDHVTNYMHGAPE